MNALKQTVVRMLAYLLPPPMKSSIFHLSFHLAHDEFQRFAHLYAFAPNMRLGLQEMAVRGFTPRVIVDVGAYQGDWSKMAKQLWPTCHVIMIDGNNVQRGALDKVANELEAELFLELLGDEDGKSVIFNVMGSGSSVLSERSPLPRREEIRTLRSLDSLLPQVHGPALLKIDAQGYELEILKGASRLLPEFEAIVLEVAILEVNDGAPLLHDVLAFMKARGFVTYDILEIHRRPLDGALNQIDIVFVKESSTLIADKRHFAVER